MKKLAKFHTLQRISARNIHVSKTIAEFRCVRSNFADKTVGFVPTMGALHQGHISLVRKARELNSVVICSLFVNPTQFSAGEDLHKYPRQFDKDMELLKEAGVDYVFAPSTEEMYSKSPLCFVVPTWNIFEGRARPDFFKGVATVVWLVLDSILSFFFLFYYFILHEVNSLILYNLQCHTLDKKIFLNVFLLNLW